jgi:chromosome segregation ATPase
MAKSESHEKSAQDANNQPSLRSSLRILEEREQEHRETLLRLQGQIDSKTLHLQELSRQLAEHSALVLEVETYGKTLEEIKSRLVEGRTRLGAVQEEVGSAERQLGSLHDKMRAEERRIADGREEVNHLRQSVEFLTERIAGLRSEEAKLNGEIGRQMAALDEGQERLRKLEEQEREYRMRFAESERSLELLNTEIKGRQSDIESMGHTGKLRREELATLSSQLDDKRRQLGSIEMRCEDAESRVAQLLARSGELEGRNEAIRGEFASLQLQIGEKMSELSELLQNRDKLLGEVRDSSNVRAKLVKEVEELESRKEETHEAIESLQTERHNAESESNLTKTRLGELAAQELHKSDTLKRMASQVAFFEEKLVVLRDENAELDMRGKVLKDDIGNHEQFIAEQRHLEAECAKRLDADKAALSELNNQRTVMASELVELGQRKESLELEIDRLLGRIREEGQKSNLLESEVRGRREALHELDLEKSMRRSELEAMHNKLRGYSNEEKDIISRKASLDSLLVSLQEQIRQSEKVLADTLKRIEGERTRMSEEVERASAAAQMTARNRSFLEETARQLQALQSERDRAQVELLDLRRQTLEKAEELGELETLRQDKIARIDELNKEIGTLRSERDREDTARLEAPDSLSRRRLANLKESLLRLQTEIDVEFPAEDKAKGGKKAS